MCKKGDKMKKTWVMALLLTIVVTGCAKKEVKTTIEPTSTPVTQEQNEEVANKVYEGIVFKVDAKLQNKSVKGNLIISNASDEVIPLYFEDTIATYEVRDADGSILTTASIKEGNRSKLQSKEEIKYPFEFSTQEAKGGTVTIVAKLSLLDREHEVYNYDDLKVQTDIGIPVNFTYLPSKVTTYTYIKPNEEQIYKEKYAFVQNGQIQQNSELTGVSVFTEDAKGVYLTYQDPEKLNVNSPSVIGKVSSAEKQQILALPAQKGKTWTSAGVKYTILDTNKTLTVPAGTFSGVVEVQMDVGNDVRLYYAKGVGLIEVAVVTEGGINPQQMLQKME